MRAWVKHNKQEDMADLLLTHDLNAFTPAGILCHYKETAEAEETKIMPTVPLKELYNLYWYLNMMMISNLTILLMRIIGDCKQEERL